MTNKSMKIGLYTVVSVLLLSTSVSWAEMRFIQIEAKSKEQRSAIADLGVSIEATRSDSVWGFANENSIQGLSKNGFKVLGNFEISVGRGGHEGGLDFPGKDAKFHNYQEVTDTLKLLQSKNADISKVISIGKSTEGKEMWALHVNTTPEALMSNQSTKPGAIFMGNHHAREHLSVEIPLMWAQYLLDNRKDTSISALLESRDIWILPMINPDGAEYDVSTGSYKYWRKNRRDNKDGNYGVDLNRNYGFMWGTGGSSNDTNSDVYMGLRPFSEPETQNVKAFVEAHLNAKVLLTFHTFSELILYPWGHKYEAIENTKDHQVFEKMAATMAQWNHYTPEQASSL
ncbi:MAG: M14 family metallopeptidase, partial [Bdellovibrionota bacterium]